MNLIEIYKNHVDIPIIEYSAKIMDGKVDRYRHMVLFPYENTSKSKLYYFIVELVETRIIDPIHLSTIYKFIESYYNIDRDFAISVDDKKYSLYFDLHGELKSLVLTDDGVYYKHYRSINYIDQNSINVSKSFGLDLSNIPVSRILQVSSNSKIDGNYQYIDKYHYGFLYHVNHSIIENNIYWVSIFKNEITLYFRKNNHI